MVSKWKLSPLGTDFGSTFKQLYTLSQKKYMDVFKSNNGKKVAKGSHISHLSAYMFSESESMLYLYI